jgi:hypothetical protein
VAASLAPKPEPNPETEQSDFVVMEEENDAHSSEPALFSDSTEEEQVDGL